MSEENLPEDIRAMIQEHDPHVEGPEDLYARIYRRGLEQGLATQLFCDQESRRKFTAWLREQDIKVAAKQGRDRPYYGCSGGELVYTYCPTTIGVAMKVRHDVTGDELDLSDWG